MPTRERANRAAAKVLREGAAVIEQYGWVQGTFGHEELGYCVLGGINRAATEDDFRRLTAAVVDVGRRFARWLHANHYIDSLNHGNPVAYWNDDICTSEHEAVAMLRKAADDLAPEKI